MFLIALPLRLEQMSLLFALGSVTRGEFFFSCPPSLARARLHAQKLQGVDTW